MDLRAYIQATEILPQPPVGGGGSYLENNLVASKFLLCLAAVQKSNSRGSSKSEMGIKI